MHDAVEVPDHADSHGVREPLALDDVLAARERLIADRHHVDPTVRCGLPPVDGEPHLGEQAINDVLELVTVQSVEGKARVGRLLRHGGEGAGPSSWAPRYAPRARQSSKRQVSRSKPYWWADPRERSGGSERRSQPDLDGADSRFQTYTLMNGWISPRTPHQRYTFRSAFTQVLETPRIRLGGYDYGRATGRFLRCAKKPSGETECRIVQEGRGK